MIRTISIALSLLLLDCGLTFAQDGGIKKNIAKGEKIELLKKEMSVQSWQQDSGIVFRLSGSPMEGNNASWIHVNTKTGVQTPLQQNPNVGKPIENARNIVSKEGMMNPLRSPDQKYIAFTRANNLFTLRLADNKETQLTFDGSDVIMNGYASLIYEEDVLTGGYRTFWWSPDSKHIAFYRFDDSEVPQYFLSDIQPFPIRAGRSAGRLDKRSPQEVRRDFQKNKIISYRYSHPGDRNSSVKVGFVGPEQPKIVWADFKMGEDCYFGDPYWRPDSKGLWVQWMNRGQDTLNIYNVLPETGTKQLVYTEFQRTWVMINYKERVRFLPSGNAALIASDKSGWDQLYLYSLEGRLLNKITDGEYKVLDVLHIDEKNKSLYFTCFKDHIAFSDLYRVGLDGRNLKRLTFGDYSHKISISPNAKYFVTTYFNPATPERVALLNTDGHLVADLYDRKGADFGKYETDRYEVITVKSDDGNFDLPMRVRWPAGMEKGKKYPLHVRVYGGPNMMWMTQPYFSAMAAESDDEKSITVFMDHRGSGLCGKIGADYMHRNLGYWEMTDYTTLVKWLIENGQVDPNKVLIQGHSYGGYLSCYALTNGNGIFQSAIAGAPVTDWLLYNAAYTERYMDSPDENEAGYKKSSAVYNAEHFNGRLLISHGSSDENVHPQNTLHFVGELQRLNKEGVEMVIYPEDGHSLIGKHLNHHNAKQQEFRQKALFNE